MRWKKDYFAVAGLLLAIAAPTNAGLAQDVDPKLANSWKFVQETMPGVPYSVLAAACEEGNLMVYAGTWIDAQEAQIDKFMERFPCIDVQKFTAATGERRERFLAEYRAGRHVADIIQDTDVGTLNQQAANGLLTEYTISNDATFAKGTKKSGYWYPLRVAMVGIAWNTNLVSEEDAMALTDWKGVTDPRWKGKAAVVDPVAGGVAFLPWYVWTQLYGPDFIPKIGENVAPRVMRGTNPTSAALAAGDIAVILNASETGLLPLLAKGAPIRWSLPEPGIGPLTGQAIPDGAPHPNAAKLYQEYAFTEEGYGLWQKEGGAPARKGFKDQRAVAKETWYKMPDELYEYDPAEVTKSVDEIVGIFRKAIAGQ
jgi:ABC-type Fe3+ transport system substrate-binding protein